MLAAVPLFPEQASTTAEQVDHLFFFVLSVTGAVALLVTVLVIYFAVRYRRRPTQQRTPRILGSIKLELFWSITPLFIFFVMFGWGASVYFRISRPPANALEVFVVGKQWMWKIQHPDGQREINELHVPVDQPVKLTLISEDVIHDFFVPAFRTKVDVLPARYVQTWFQPTKIGRFNLFCSQYCGTQHSRMIGSVVVMEPLAYDAWLKQHAEGSLALEGRKLFLKLQCVTCHSADSQARAPVLEGLYGSTVHLRGGGTVVADETYIRESILRPAAKIVQGWDPIMPTFEGQVDELDLIKLTAFIKSLGRGQTPVRTEEFPPPVGAPTSPDQKVPKP
jgi:cytochrome c oxidase subunit 2